MESHCHLPHWHRPGAASFLTWRLAGSLPGIKRATEYTSEGAKFVAFDRLLDAKKEGPQWLGRRDVAEAVIRSLLEGQCRGLYELGSWVLMPNHVHVLLFPLAEVPRVVSGIKRASATEANRLLGRTGAFWSRDYFDRWVRGREQEQRIARYIENNPVKAGLCSSISDWPFSSAHERA